MLMIALKKKCLYDKKKNLIEDLNQEFKKDYETEEMQEDLEELEKFEKSFEKDQKIGFVKEVGALG